MSESCLFCDEGASIFPNEFHGIGFCDRCCEKWRSPTTPGQCSQTNKPDQPDAINPSHYKSHPSGVECIEIAEHFGYNLGNALKYIWRAGLKGDAVVDLKKAAWYLDREIKRREKLADNKEQSK